MSTLKKLQGFLSVPEITAQALHVAHLRAKKKMLLCFRYSGKL